MSSQADFPTCRSASFSSFSSFSFAFVAASAFLSSLRFSHEVWFARGRKADLLSCHCFPTRQSAQRGKGAARPSPFFFIPLTAVVAAAAGAVVSTVSDIAVAGAPDRHTLRKS